MKEDIKEIRDAELEGVSGGDKGANGAAASIACEHCGGKAIFALTGWQGFVLFDCPCGWRTKFKGEERIGCYNKADRKKW